MRQPFGLWLFPAMSTDHFAQLGLPRRPWLDADMLKNRFHQLSAERHPDAAGDTGKFTALNTAYAVVRDPAARLKHLLELEAPEALDTSATAIPPWLAERFMQVATLRRELDAFVHERGAATTPLARALAASEAALQRHDVERTVAKLEAARDRCIDAVRQEDAAWDQRDEAAGARIAALQRELSFLSRWIDQLREGLLQLSL
jgi:curved DNA-binding protein CbpA